MINVAIVGFGNVGRGAYDALKNAPDMTLRCVVESAPQTDVPEEVRGKWAESLEDITKYGAVDVAVLCVPSRLSPDMAEKLLTMGIRTADAFDIHTEIWPVKCRLGEAARKHQTAGIIAAGWDPGTDSIVRALMEVMAPAGISYVNFGPGMSMGHTVAAKAIEGVENALSMTMPVGAGVHRRMVYVQLKAGASLDKVSQSIKADEYFAHDDTHVIQVDDVNALLDVGHGVEITRKGVSGKTHNQQFAFSMKANNPALTSQVLIGMARAVMKQSSGCYTMLEIPLIDMLPGEREDLVKRLV